MKPPAPDPVRVGRRASERASARTHAHASQSRQSTCLAVTGATSGPGGSSCSWRMVAYSGRVGNRPVGGRKCVGGRARFFSCSGTECAAEAGTSTGGRRYPRDSSDSASLWRTGRAPTGAAEVPNDRRTEHSWDRVPGAAERHNGNLAQTRTRCDGRQIADLSWPVISVTVSLETNLGLFRPDRWAHRQIGRGRWRGGWE